MQHRIDLQEARTRAATDAAEAIASLRRQLDRKSDQHISALRDCASLQIQAEEKIGTALGPSLRPGLLCAPAWARSMLCTTWNANTPAYCITPACSTTDA